MLTTPAPGFAAALNAQAAVSDQAWAAAQAACARHELRLAQALARLGLAAESDIAAALAVVSGLPLAPRSRLSAVDALPTHVSAAWLIRAAALPLAVAGNCLDVAMADPEDEGVLAALLFATGTTHARVEIAHFSDIEEELARLSGAGAQAPATPWHQDAANGADAERLADSDSEAPVIRLVQRLLTQAVNRRASDVHIEPMARYVAVRYRIDGRLTEVEQLPDSFAQPVASRIKIMASLDIAESRLPQDGRLRLTVRGRDVDVRVSTSPIAHGESIVLRLLGRQEVPLDLDRLGLPEESLARMKSALDRPHGIILVTGPTGSGKTTTLYAAINRLRRPEVKILTVEDPVEVILDGINQVQVRPDIDLDYAATLRAFLRQDPDVLMIGEIRDGETADIAMRAALTGHLVLSTLHTNSAIGAFTRLRDIGVEPFLTASTVIASLAQRLVRRLCAECRAPAPARAEDAALYVAHAMPCPDTLWQARGCAACGDSGYRGRAPIIEIFEVDDAARAAIRDGHIGDWEDGRSGAHTLAGHGLALAASGVTSIAEVARVVEAG